MEGDKLTKVYQQLLTHFGRQNWWPTSKAFPREEWEIMVGAVLTQNTSWKNVEKALKQLADAQITTIGSFLAAEAEVVKKAIRPSGYYRQKYRRITRLGQLIKRKKQNEDLASNEKALQKLKQTLTRAELLEVKGIGPETADAILLYTFNRLEFVIDAYTRRVLKRLELADGDESYNQLKTEIERALEEDLVVYQEFHALLDELAKNYCTKNDPNCTGCPLRDMCPSCNQKKLKID